MERKTIISTHISNLFNTSKTPLSLHQIIDHLNKKQLYPNKSTLYRILDKLLSKKSISQISTRSGTNYYELKTDQHHHHFVCTKCQTAYCLNTCHIDTQNINLSKLLPNMTFLIESHEFNLYGTCEKCST